MDEYDESVEGEDCRRERDQAQESEDPFASHGGDPRLLDLTRCLLLSSLPTAFLSDPYDVFNNCMLDWISQDFKVSRDAIDKVVRLPKLQPEAENPVGFICCVFVLLRNYVLVGQNFFQQFSDELLFII
ncbi:hypothetical protein OESDEN_17905 [Oesophagostomum dentatum]|uniref:Uncharacterized protein n=1 Tax=Oesophagostomum dentatum TaxID=61180 RepID=A0A0B1SES6_OESDE|nr:hypothetical protein OESDEN_17905 [Oesophagostomum dentatum]